MTYTRRRPHNYYQGRNSYPSGARRSGFSGRSQNAKRQRMNTSHFIKKAENTPTRETYIPKHAFADFPFASTLKQHVLRRGYKTPMPIQDQAIPYILQGRDVVGIANTGTGKTAAFLLPLIQKLLDNNLEKLLVVAPTRELAVQIRDEYRAFTEGMFLPDTLCIGGVGMYQQIRGLQRNPRVVIGTPGRLKDLVNQRKLTLSSFGIVVLDEVDRMLDMGFIRDVRFLISLLPHNRQSLFFSATIPPDVQGVMEAFLKNPVTVSVKTRETAENVDQDVVRLAGRAKIDVLHDLLSHDEYEKVIVFGRTKWGIEKLSRALEQRGLRVAAIHGNKNQNQRQRALEAFKANRIQALLATDVASRGLDIENVTHVINYDIPETYDDYIHRIGRTGRAEKKGVALTFIE
ncbi:MAG: DEAD/DEAH box helicase [Candidatus Levybacteria bacterium]|nr:DEAD/DEAH box helicase [Candidatus Levybacteria bacterium]